MSKSEQSQLESEVFEVAYCRGCEGKNLYGFLQLGPTPAPNKFLSKEELSQAEKFYPLDVSACNDCGMVQLGHVVDPNVLFSNYVYVPSTSLTMRRHFDELAQEAIDRTNVAPGSLVIDIGSNDGTLLKSFKQKNMHILGIDPAANLAETAISEGVPTVNALFNKYLAQDIRTDFGPAEIITGTNVVAHVHDLHDFFEGINVLMSDKGRFIGEFPYLIDMLKKTEFDTIYQEHLSYLALSPIQRILQNHNLVLLDAQRQSIHGGSIRIFVGKAGEPSGTIQQLANLEKEVGITKEETYNKFRSRVDRIRHDLMQKLYTLRNEGKKVVGYGAAAKGNVLLNYCRIGRETLDYIVDSTPYKHGRFTPGMRIPVEAENKLLADQPDYALLLAWNFASEILAKQQEFQIRGGRFIMPIPEVSTVYFPEPN